MRIKNKKKLGRIEERAKKNRAQEEWRIEVAYKFLKIIIIIKERHRKGIPQLGNARKETIRVEVASN